jgi:hypothetical protein
MTILRVPECIKESMKLINFLTLHLNRKDIPKISNTIKTRASAPVSIPEWGDKRNGTVILTYHRDESLMVKMK